ncbi:ATP-grasp domain-containing protein [Paludisphaera soli]|uniref:ATP-grasp domain-containing protein n=1 Tax=Paludisphaera soli TaxID=2712865 RepID=UPI0013ECE71B|nr:ATP-grasp domain-containing protein [Paludisphaera soli]
MLLVFCRDPLESARPDRSFRAEVQAAEALDVERILIDHDALVRGESPGRMVRGVAERPEPTTAVYRGWMTTPAHYAVLHDALAGRNIRLVNDPAQYRHCHHLPDSYEAIAGLTPRSVWLEGDPGLDRIMASLATFGGGPAIVKDFVKSRKHEWFEACFLPRSDDREAVARVVGRFRELQGDDLAGGLVFREYVEFQPIGTHPRSGMPIVDEHRIFWLDGQPIFHTPYWEGFEAAGQPPPVADFAEAAARVPSRFFAMDVARRRDGAWMIVELGDGQVSGLPREADAPAFHATLLARLGRAG